MGKLTLMNTLSKNLSGMSVEKREYILRNAVKTFIEARQYDKLRLLFDNDTWMLFRFEENGYNYDAYLNDLELSWKISYEKAKNEAAGSTIGQSFLDCFHYALIQSSIISISENYVPEIIEIAIERDLWNIRKGLSLFYTVSDKEHKLKICKAILKKKGISQSQQTKMQNIGLEIASSLSEDLSRAEALIMLAPLLSKTQLTTVIDSTLAIRDNDIKVLTLLTLFPHLSDKEKKDFLQLSLEIVHLQPDSLVDWRVVTLWALTAHLNGSEKNQIINEIFDIAFSRKSLDEEEGFALAVITPLLSKDQIDYALGRIQNFHKKWTHAMILAVLSTRLAGEKKQMILQEALEIIADGDSEERMITLLVIAAQLKPGSKRNRIIQECLEIISSNVRSDGFISQHNMHLQLIGLIALNLSEQVSYKVFENAFELALALGDEEVRFFHGELSPCTRGFELLAPLLDSRFILQALDIVKNLKGSENQARALSALASRLALYEKALQIALDITLTISDLNFRARALRALAPYLSVGLLHDALHAFLDIDDKWLCSIALAKMIPFWPEEEKNELLSKILDASLATQQKEGRLHALTAITPLLNDNLKLLALEEAFSEAMKLPAKAGSVFFSSVYGPLHSPLGDALVKLAPELTDKARQNRVLNIIDILPEDKCAKILSILWPNIVHELIPQIEEEFEKLPYTWRAWVSSEVVPKLKSSQDAQSLLQKGLEAAFEVEKPIDKSILLTLLLPYLVEKEPVVQAILDIISQITDAQSRIEASGKIMPFLKGKQRREILSYCLDALNQIEDHEHFIFAVSELIDYLDEKQKREMLNICLSYPSNLNSLIPLAKVLDTALRPILNHINTIEDLDDRMKLFTGFIPNLSEESLSSALKYFHLSLLDKLQTLRQTKRMYLLNFSIQLIFDPMNFQECVLIDFANQLKQVCWDWNWQ